MNKPTLDVIKARNETPNCEKLLHFNNAGASLMPTPVVEALQRHLALESEIGGYEAEDQQEQAMHVTYNELAHLLNCLPTEIALTENATRAWDMLIYSLPWKKGDEIITGVDEYASNYLAFLQLQKKYGINIQVIPSDELGLFSIEKLGEKINSQTKLIALTHVPSHGGIVHPAEQVGKIAKENKILYMLDISQSVGQMPIDVKKMHCDMAVAPGRKFLRGPRGTGFLYVSQSLLENIEPVFVDLYSAAWTKPNQYQWVNTAQRFETWEKNCAAYIGLAAAVKYANQWDLTAIQQRNNHLADYLRQELRKIAGVSVYATAAPQSSIVPFATGQANSETVKNLLRQEQINVSLIRSKQHAQLALGVKETPDLIRASIHYYNTEKEIEVFCKQIKKLLD